MATLNVKDPLAHVLATQIAEQTGETLTDAVITSLLDRLNRVQARQKGGDRKERLLALIEKAAEEPLADSRSVDEILGYDETGLPG